MIFRVKKSVLQDFFKSVGRSHLVRQQKQIIRNGKVVNTFVWTNPDKNKKKVAKKEKSENNINMRTKKGLKKTEEIANYLESKLSKMGFKVKQDYSGLSNSRYITVENYNEMTGKQSSYNDNELKIRISDHDLPPSYDGLHGYHDIDIMSNNKDRSGNDGNATNYESLLQKLNSEILNEKKQEIKTKDKSEKQQNSEAKKILPEWTESEKKIREKLENEKDINTRFLLVTFANFKQKERAKKILEYINNVKNNKDSAYYDSFVKLGLIKDVSM